MNPYPHIRDIYNKTVRDYLPKKDRTLTSVQVHDTPILDRTADNPLYKIGLILSIYDNVSKGDSVEIVGFGRGVTTTHVLWAGADNVVGYDGAINMIEKGTNTVKRNYDDSPPLKVHHAIVGDPVDVYGQTSEASTIPPSDLSQSDTLVLDCEGAEISILSDLGSYPDTVICESHPTKGAPAKEIEELLEGQYSVTKIAHKPKPNAKAVVIGKLK